MGERVGSDRIKCVVASLWCWLGPLAILAVVFWRTSAQESMTRRVCAEVVNLQIALLVPTAASIGAVLVGWDAVALLLWAVAFLPVAIYSYVVGLIGAWRAWHGAAWR